MKLHLNSLNKGSKLDQYVVQNLAWSGVYLRINFSNTLIQKVLTLFPLTATRPEVFISAMTTFLFDSYDALKETIDHVNSINLHSYPGENATYCCATILVDADIVE